LVPNTIYRGLSSITYIATTLLALAWGQPGLAQDAPSLVQDAKNPFADLVNVQIFYDVSPGVGQADNTQQTLTLQPLLPFHLNSDWIVITRTVLPVIEQPPADPGGDWVRGVGDTQFAALLSPAHVGALDWGIGTVLQLPTASRDALGQGKWGAGPAAGMQWTGAQWTLGLLVMNTWSFAGEASRPDVNQMQIQPSVNYTFRNDPNRYLTFGPTITANWDGGGGQRWTVPVSLGIGQLLKLGRQSVNLQASTYYNLVSPTGSGHWTFEMLVQFLLPESKKTQ
jgi:hypothetical protein